MSIVKFLSKAKTFAIKKHVGSILGIIANFGMSLFHFVLIFTSRSSFTIAPTIFFGGFGIIKIVMLKYRIQEKEKEAVKFFLICSSCLYILLPLSVGYKIVVKEVPRFPWEWMFFVYALFAVVRIGFSIAFFAANGRKGGTCDYCLSVHGIITAVYFFMMMGIAWCVKFSGDNMNIATRISLLTMVIIITFLCMGALVLYARKYTKIKANF